MSDSVNIMRRFFLPRAVLMYRIAPSSACPFKVLTEMPSLSAVCFKLNSFLPETSASAPALNRPDLSKGTARDVPAAPAASASIVRTRA
jgi:hypothetical protein